MVAKVPSVLDEGRRWWEGNKINRKGSFLSERHDVFGPRRRILDCVSLFCCLEAKKHSCSCSVSEEKNQRLLPTRSIGPLWENVGFSGRAKPARIHGMLCYV